MTTWKPYCVLAMLPLVFALILTVAVISSTHQSSTSSIYTIKPISGQWPYPYNLNTFFFKSGFEVMV